MKSHGMIVIVSVILLTSAIFLYRWVAAPREPPGIPVAELQSACGAFYWHYKRWPRDVMELTSSLNAKHRRYLDDVQSRYKVKYGIEIKPDAKIDHKATVIVIQEHPNGSQRFQRSFSVTKTWYESEAKYSNYIQGF